MKTNYERLAAASRAAWRAAMRDKMREQAMEFRVQSVSRAWDGDFNARIKSMLRYRLGAVFYRGLSL